MSLGITHKKVSAKSDSSDSTIVQPSDWNDDHKITGDVDFQGHAILNASDELSLQAGEDVGGHRVVKTVNNSGHYADSGRTEDAFSVVGISKGAASNGGFLTIVTYGSISEPSWNWQSGLPIYLGQNARLTQALPTEGFILEIATVLDKDRIFVNLKQPIFLA